MRPIKHFFPQPPIDTARLSIHGLGIRQPMRAGLVDRPGGTGDYLFMFLYDRVRLRLEGAETWYPPETLIVWRPEDGHYYGNPETPWRHSWIHCDGSWIGKWLAEADVPTARPLSFPHPAGVEDALEEIFEELQTPAAPDAVIVGNLLENWIRRIGRQVHGPGPKPSIPKKFLDLKRHLDEHFAEPVRLAGLAKRTHCSVPHFCSEFRRYFGTSAIAYVTRLRLHRAAYLLADRNLRVGQIARAVGYEDLYYFSRHFKKHFGLCPTGMRRR